LWLAESALAQRDVERTCALLREVIPAVRTADSTRNHSRLTGVRTQLKDHFDVPAVKELDEWSRV